ncbi:MAG TPA: reverse transcriptase domain-containing protein [Pirellulales bacterium]|nr:reverse transcriptase domain-containing protein [Pirellulales bacterium]
MKGLEQSGLISPSDLRALREKLPPERQRDAQELARELVRRKVLTTYQVKEAYQGKASKRVPGYVRYADDMVLFAASKSQLWEHRDALESRLAQLRLKLHSGKTQVRPSPAGLKFLGFVLGRSGRRLQQSAAQRFNGRVRRLRWLKARRKTTPADIGRSTRAWLAHAQGANSTGLRRELWKRMRF